MRELKRQIAKARLKALGVGNVNKKISSKSGKNEPKLWRRVLDGDLAKHGMAAQFSQGIKSKRKIKKIGA